jgi:putative tryptophan/tyrosine transport system substrate-binding protein
MYPTPDFARSGGVIAYGRDIADPMRRMAHYVNQIIKGAKPGDLPFEHPPDYISSLTSRQLQPSA